ncbi:GNAT family N-acetyltransferase [Actinoplanes sp. NPDC049548]|uniref:GNAT family N-acetyltransferase n=1 Tax=Actinoplanes sp. NPDC049548 TaxID=3155152 RepID=UPI00342EBEDD
MRIERITEAATVHRAADLFDGPPLPDATAKFLAAPGHHLLMAFEGDRALGMVTGVEMTHPDKGTEMFLYELGVAPHARLRGVGTALVEALAEVARERGCYGMWVGTEQDNEAAQKTYRKAGASDEEPFLLLSWDVTQPRSEDGQT